MLHVHMRSLISWQPRMQFTSQSSKLIDCRTLLLRAAQELEKLNRQKRVSLLQAQRSRAAAVIYTRQQTTLAAVQRVNVQRAREAHARAAAPGSLAGCGGRDRIDYRLTRIHDTAGQQQAAATAASKPFSIVRYGDYLHQLQARGTLDADSNQRCYQWCG